MAPPSTLTIVLVAGNNPSSVSMSISSGLQSFEGAGMGLASDEAIRNVFRAGVFRDSAGVWHPVSQILTITAS